MRALSSQAPAASGRCGGRTHAARRAKRGGLRVIYYYFSEDLRIWLLTIYDKDEAKDLTADQRRMLKAAIEQEKRERANGEGDGGRTMRKQPRKAKRRDIFGELMSGVTAMREHREGRVTLRECHVEPLHLPRVDGDTVRETRRRLGMSRSVFAYRLGVNLRTIERWEQGRGLPNEQAAALILLVRRYPDTLDRLASLEKTA